MSQGPRRQDWQNLLFVGAIGTLIGFVATVFAVNFILRMPEVGSKPHDTESTKNDEHPNLDFELKVSKIGVKQAID